MEVFDPLAPSFRINPYPVYKHFRTHHPIYAALAPDAHESKLWYFFRYEDVTQALRDVRLGREPQARPAATCPWHSAANPFYEMAAQWMLYRDPPAYTRLRALVSKAFTPRLVAQAQPDLELRANELLEQRQSQGTLDIIEDLALPLALSGITRLLGVPIADHGQFRLWSNALSAAIDQNRTPGVYERANEATVALGSYLQEIIRARRAQPRDDLISHLCAATAPSDIVPNGNAPPAKAQPALGERQLSQDEIIATCILLLGAGQETTVDLIGNSVLALLRHPDQFECLKADPTLVPRAIEELLRYDSPVQMTARIAHEDVEIRGQTIRRGDKITLVLGAANRDPEVFTDPDRLDLTRQSALHTSFGWGIHFCLGASLARATGQTALNGLLQRWPRMSLMTASPQWRAGPVFRGLKELPVRF